MDRLAFDEDGDVDGDVLVPFLEVGWAAAREPLFRRRKSCTKPRRPSAVLGILGKYRKLGNRYADAKPAPFSLLVSDSNEEFVMRTGFSGYFACASA